MALARAWTNRSTCPIVGNNQKSGSFWKEVCKKFHALMQKEPYREVNSVGSKYREMNKKISAFCGYYNNAHSNRPSGASDETVLAIAMSKYHTKEVVRSHTLGLGKSLKIVPSGRRFLTRWQEQRGLKHSSR
ncbi:putative glutathione transferase [Helianthus annuus]|nr:putative glutathione transferase [Helianthus annuus]KAJ0584354.1 putative glutathione transferase [Helianthus annuus]KAJ0746985.1 putative glutathione transferase [Helianthus annuus]